MKKILILGHTGMLGHVVLRYFKEQLFKDNTIEIITIDKRIHCVDDILSIINFILENNIHTIINCLGITNKRDVNQYHMCLLNDVLPNLMCEIIQENGTFYHISTDCVFNGKKGLYTTNNKPNAIDDYGLYKRLGEKLYPNKIVLRTSIIGPENLKESKNSGGLYQKAKDGHIKEGYSNHIWSGVTTLHLAKLIYQNIISDFPKFIPNQLYHISTKPISKYNLVSKISPINVKKTESPNPINRSLIPSFEYEPDIFEQIKEMEQWYNG